MTLQANFISEHWPLDQVSTSLTLQQYSTRAVFGVTSAQGRFVVKVFDNGAALGLVSPSLVEIRQCLFIFDYLEQQKFPYIPALLKTRSGDSFIQYEGKTIYLIEWLDGERPLPSPEVYAKLGQIAAGLNSHTDYPHSYPIDVQGTIAELRLEAEDYPFTQGFLQQVDQLDVLIDQPQALIHGEINIDNALQTRDGMLYLLDWDSVGTGPLVLEAGYPLLTCFLTEDLSFHQEWAAAFYDGYTQGKGIANVEKELVFTAALLHALRYLKFGDSNKRWARICYALMHKDDILSAIP
jgi:Ser/Thr protein kinase RdoA (MazF antagonist)